MSLRRALAELDPIGLATAFDTSFDETGIMVDRLADGFRALAGLTDRLQVRIREELDDEEARTHATLGAVLVHARARGIRHRR